MFVLMLESMCKQQLSYQLLKFNIVYFYMLDLYKILDQYINDKIGWSTPLEFNISPASDPNPEYIDICTVLTGDIPYALHLH